MISRFLTVIALVLAATAATAQPKPATTLTITNGREQFTAVAVVVTAGKRTIRLSSPLKPKAQVTMKLPRIKGCSVGVVAAFRYESRVEIVDIDDLDLCQGTASVAFKFTDPPAGSD